MTVVSRTWLRTRLKGCGALVRSALLCAILFVCLISVAFSAPIQKIRGVITEVEEGILWLKPDGESTLRKFNLRWKARFVPPKLPLKGDHVLILYKEKEEGAVIYGVNYLSTGDEFVTQKPRPESRGKERP